MSRPTKFTPGPEIFSLVAVVVLIEQGHWLYLHHKPMSPAWMRNMSLAMLAGSARYGSICLALPNPEHPVEKARIAADESRKAAFRKMATSRQQYDVS